VNGTLNGFLYLFRNLGSLPCYKWENLRCKPRKAEGSTPDFTRLAMSAKIYGVRKAGGCKMIPEKCCKGFSLVLREACRRSSSIDAASRIIPRLALQTSRISAFQFGVNFIVYGNRF